ncbi:uncharacterized protein LOC125226921 [Leguminivora glycinivorella]|uniref:uncharacterized protein LOC125226921 n=1 Tax=Leguminivora glycinivorella TaxID=1035111 RepID=UPI00200F38E3|nr:uncharacterized protein LOC125226921 [Leguminivora glycinivorella]
MLLSNQIKRSRRERRIIPATAAAAAAAAMSPLACLLLAFAALFAAADGVKLNYCGYLMLGEETKDHTDFRLTAPGGDVQIPDKCSRPGRRLVGEYISVCDPPYYQPIVTPAMTGSPYLKPVFKLVNIQCPSGIKGCDNLDVHVTQFCEIVTGPH